MTAPLVGQIVHYRSYGTPGGEYQPMCRAAIVTEVPPLLEGGPNSGPEGYVEAVNLAVMNPKGVFFDDEVPYHADREGGTWHYQCQRSN